MSGALVINFVIIPLLFIGSLLTVASSISDEIKLGFCVAALCAGTPPSQRLVCPDVEA